MFSTPVSALRLLPSFLFSPALGLAGRINFHSLEKTKQESTVHKFIKNIKHTSEYRMLNHIKQPRSTNKIMRIAQLPEQNSFLHCTALKSQDYLGILSTQKHS